MLSLSNFYNMLIIHVPNFVMFVPVQMILMHTCISSPFEHGNTNLFFIPVYMYMNKIMIKICVKIYFNNISTNIVKYIYKKQLIIKTGTQLINHYHHLLNYNYVVLISEVLCGKI